MKKLIYFFTGCLLFTVLSQVEAEEFKIDAHFPGGNIIVRSIKGDVIVITPDRRDSSKGECSYRHWYFRVIGAQGRTLKFEFEKDRTSDIFGHLTTRGPVISRDGRKSWNWLVAEGESPNPPNSFVYTFGQEEKEVYFTVVRPYTEETLRQFLATIPKSAADKANFRLETLCKTEKGRDVELIRFGTENNPKKIGIFICARQHSNETVSDYVVEGIILEALSGSDTGKKILANADFFIVPMVDKDGVEDGDQGKSRLPHDHNRDYDKGKYATVRAIREQTVKWGRDKTVFAFDFHANSLDHRGPRLNDPTGWCHHMFFFVHSTRTIQNEKAFGEILKGYQKNNGIFYDGKSDILQKKQYLALAHTWFSEKLNTVFSCSSEVPTCRLNGQPYTVEEYHELGANIVKAIASYPVP